MPGHMGDERVTMQALEVVRVDPAQGLLLVKGTVPGSENQVVLIHKSRKPPKAAGVHAPAQKKKQAPAPPAKPAAAAPKEKKTGAR